MGIPNDQWVRGQQSHMLASLLLNLLYFMSVALALLDGTCGLRQKGELQQELTADGSL